MSRRAAKKAAIGDRRLQLLMYGIIVAVLLIVGRLFFLMVMNHQFYADLAAGSHELYAKLFPKRGRIYMQDTRTREEFPLAMNRDVFLLYADTRQIENDETAEHVAGELAAMLGYDDEQKLALYYKINKRDDPYEPIEPRVEEEVKAQIEEKELAGLRFVRKSERFYPEGQFAASVVGFVGKNDDGQDVGRYGVEGYWQETLAGNQGFLAGIRGAGGSLITSAANTTEQAKDGADLLLTIDRTLQFQACDELRKAMETYEAQSASLVMMDPHTGAILAMCSLPDFDPNTYNQVESVAVYNNSSIFTPYEPGSIFKPITMAAAVNEELLTPNSIFYDSGEKDGVCQKPIKNADGKIYKDQTMTGVLENSINTGMVYVAEQLGKKQFRRYVEDFGFGVKEGIKLHKEVSGTVETLSIKKGDDIDCYGATASFGQGITATPLQMVASFAPIANGGRLMQPYIVSEVRHADGTTDKVIPKEIRQVLSSRSASLVSGMLVSVVDSGHAGAAGVDGYYVAGKTGTAQIAEKGKYTDETNHSFVGFAPVDNPKFVMIVKFEKPQRRFSSATAAPTFGKIARFALQYYGIAPAR